MNDYRIEAEIALNNELRSGLTSARYAFGEPCDADLALWSLEEALQVQEARLRALYGDGEWGYSEAGAELAELGH